MSESKIRKIDMHPAMGMLANTICILGETDGFCSPSNKEVCACWDRAEKMLHGSGLSAQACKWVLMHKSKIEEAAEKEEYLKAAESLGLLEALIPKLLLRVEALEKRVDHLFIQQQAIGPIELNIKAPDLSGVIKDGLK